MEHILLVYPEFKLSLIFIPSDLINPLSRFNNPNTQFIKVVFPEPEEPIKPTFSPFFISKLMSLIA